MGGIGNIYPEIEEAFYTAIKQGNYSSALHIIQQYEDPLFDVFGPIGWHRALQIALTEKKLLVTTNRAPFAKARKEHVEGVRNVLRLIESRLEKGL